MSLVAREQPSVEDAAEDLGEPTRRLERHQVTAGHFGDVRGRQT